MAKRSIRSKWGRARRTDKRVMYAKKELAELKELVQKREERENLKVIAAKGSLKLKTENEPVSSPTTSRTALAKSNSRNERKAVVASEYNHKTLQNKQGAFPPWLHLPEIMRIKKETNMKSKAKKVKRLAL